MRHFLNVLVLSTLVASLAGCAFFTRGDDEPPEEQAPAAAPAADPHAGHDHP